MWPKFEICFLKGTKHCGKRWKCWLSAFSPFPTMFSKAFSVRVVESRDCVVQGWIVLNAEEVQQHVYMLRRFSSTYICWGGSAARIYAEEVQQHVYMLRRFSSTYICWGGSAARIYAEEVQQHVYMLRRFSSTYICWGGSTARIYAEEVQQHVYADCFCCTFFPK